MERGARKKKPIPQRTGLMATSGPISSNARCRENRAGPAGTGSRNNARFRLSQWNGALSKVRAARHRVALTARIRKKIKEIIEKSVETVRIFQKTTAFSLDFHAGADRREFHLLPPLKIKSISGAEARLEQRVPGRRKIDKISSAFSKIIVFLIFSHTPRAPDADFNCARLCFAIKIRTIRNFGRFSIIFRHFSAAI